MTERQQHVAFYQVSLMRDELGTPQMEGFEPLNAQLNEVADTFPGIVYRFKDPHNALHHRLYAPENPLIVSQLLVATSPEVLLEFGNTGLHRESKRSAERYFDRQGIRAIFPHNMVLWCVDIGQEPHITQGKEKLIQLNGNGPSEEVFTFREAIQEMKNGR